MKAIHRRTVTLRKNDLCERALTKQRDAFACGQRGAYIGIRIIQIAALTKRYARLPVCCRFGPGCVFFRCKQNDTVNKNEPSLLPGRNYAPVKKQGSPNGIGVGGRRAEGPGRATAVRVVISAEENDYCNVY